MKQIATGRLRFLTTESKVSRPVLANIARHAASDPAILNNITQAAGGTLYDLNGKPVFYEVAMNRDEYEYIWQNGFYNAKTQIDYGKTGDLWWFSMYGSAEGETFFEEYTSLDEEHFGLGFSNPMALVTVTGMPLTVIVVSGFPAIAAARTRRQSTGTISSCKLMPP